MQNLSFFYNILKHYLTIIYCFTAILSSNVTSVKWSFLFFLTHLEWMRLVGVGRHMVGELFAFSKSSFSS